MLLFAACPRVRLFWGRCIGENAMTKVCLIVLLLIFPLAAAPATVRGVVINPSKAPVLDAKVSLTDVYKAAAGVVSYVATDSHGRFTIANVPLGTYFVHAQKCDSGYGDPAFAFFAVGAPAFPKIKIETEDQQESVTVKLGKPGGVLAASIVDAERGTSVERVRYRLSIAEDPHLYISSSATEDGKILTPAPPLLLDLEVTAPGYEAAIMLNVKNGKWSKKDTHNHNEKTASIK